MNSITRDKSIHDKQNRFISFLWICILSSAGCIRGQTISTSENHASDSQNISRPQTTLHGVVTDIVTANPIAGVSVSVAGRSSTTNAKGDYSIAGLSPGVYQMEITGASMIPRTLLFEQKEHTSLDITVKTSEFNNAMFWASASHNGHIMRWRNPPQWILYTQVLDSDPLKPFPPDEMAYLLRIIQKELPAISPFFHKPKIEIFKGRPNEDPRWTGQDRADGYILCAPADTGGGHSNWKATGHWVRYAKIRNNYTRAPKVWRHEIAHALGMGHAFDNKQWLPLGAKDSNYRSTKLHDGVEMYTEWDKLWLHCVYSGPRPAGNTPPDCDPNNFIHGRDTILVDPLPADEQIRQ